ncbi:Os01g0117500 [Oryza sativa Japonica Group]|uniref:Os01g0117500 protein n=1 Tax=Oryza sativa subsp. japonica TaxID=39947 RepID=A0A0P0UXI3_ORYSJ|nr:Os01g0117500 [Oryza sativa Japonica Group]
MPPMILLAPSLALATKPTSPIWWKFMHLCLFLHWTARSSQMAPFRYQFFITPFMTCPRSEEVQKESSISLIPRSGGIATIAHSVNNWEDAAHSARKGIKHSACVEVLSLNPYTTGTTSSVAAFVVLLLMVATALYLSLKTRYNEEIHLKVEMFLKTYGTSKPTRYTFSEVKKIARRFKVKVGQGGFGSVYRGELPNGVPVAVKMLENSEGEGDEFINEVATIGRIHHANIVRLLGFCSEGTRRALIYEYMPNDSLEKYVFSHDSDTSQEVLVPSKMLDIAIGIARGMEYLHQGCNQRILHFDIKPNNILLDYNFSPKISDFGLAKLCARDQSIVTLTAARGTMGYIAPELYSRNFGEISYKSDVYSFGMLVLEMVSGRRNSDPSVESQNVVYFPEWIYEQVNSGQDLALGREMTQEEKETVRQLAIVALWCIQWNPKNRPSMTKVVNMLTGRLQNLQVPPKPFLSTDSYPVL